MRDSASLSSGHHHWLLAECNYSQSHTNNAATQHVISNNVHMISFLYSNYEQHDMSMSSMIMSCQWKRNMTIVF